MKILFLLAISLLLLFSCAPKCYYTAHNGIRPKSKTFFSYSRDPYRLESTAVIDTNCIYVYSEDLMYYPTGKTTGDSVTNAHVYIRFFTNGRLLCAATDSYPVISEVNDVSSGAAGYYRIRDGKVHIQYIGSDGTLIKKTGKIEGNKLYLYYGIKKFDQPEIFEKKVFPGLTFAQPDW